jgi:phosphate transport system substrate-binding protein
MSGMQDRRLRDPHGTDGDEDEAARRPRGRRHTRLGGTVAAAATAALLLAACGSSTPSSTSTTTSSSTPTSSSTGPTGSSTSTPTNPASELAALETVPSGSVALLETGSTLLYPLFSQWSTGYHQAWSNVSITTAGTGSGTGISDAIAGTVQIGASDAYLPSADFTNDSGIENIPLAISAQQINYNLPSLSQSTHLKLNGTVIAEMYTGKITSWNDPAIAALNPGVTLPSTAVHPLHRSDGSGDTFLFSTFLNDSAPSDWTLGFNTTISWPSVANSAGDKGNSGMVAGCQATPGCIAYIGISYLSKTQAAGLGEAMLANKSGNYELPSASTIEAEASSFTSVPANGVESLIYGTAADGYPIINFEYAIVYPSKLSATDKQAVTSVLAWAMDPSHGSASSYLSSVNFQPLPSAALAVAVALLKQI